MNEDMKMAQRILRSVCWAFLLLRWTRAEYTCGTDNCWNAEGNCCRDTSLLYSGRKSGAFLMQHIKHEKRVFTRTAVDCVNAYRALFLHR
jgi:hypothetical protein